MEMRLERREGRDVNRDWQAREVVVTHFGAKGHREDEGGRRLGLFTDKVKQISIKLRSTNAVVHEKSWKQETKKHDQTSSAAFWSGS